MECFEALKKCLTTRAASESQSVDINSAGKPVVGDVIERLYFTSMFVQVMSAIGALNGVMEAFCLNYVSISCICDILGFKHFDLKNVEHELHRSPTGNPDGPYNNNLNL